MTSTGAYHKGLLTREDIKLAVSKTKSNLEAARYLGVSKKTYKKYAMMYSDEDGNNYYEAHCNKYSLGIVRKRKANQENINKLYDVITGKIPATNFKAAELKSAAIRENIIQEKCSCCGFSERRVFDEKVPIIINFRDGNRRNWHPDNLEPLCHNCYYLLVGDVYTNRQKEMLEGPDVPMTGIVKNVLDLNASEMKIIEERYNGEDLIQKL